MAPRIDIRPAVAADEARLEAWRALPEAWAALSADPLLGGPEDEPALERQDWIIEADGAPIGLISLYELDRRNARGAFAAYVAAPEPNGPGIEAFAEYWLLEYAFEGLKLAKLWSETPLSEAPACRRRLGFGFTREACLRGHLVKDGAPVDVLGLGILAADWRARRPAMAEQLRRRGYEPPEIS